MLVSWHYCLPSWESLYWWTSLAISCSGTGRGLRHFPSLSVRSQHWLDRWEMGDGNWRQILTIELSEKGKMTGCVDVILRAPVLSLEKSDGPDKIFPRRAECPCHVSVYWAGRSRAVLATAHLTNCHPSVLSLLTSPTLHSDRGEGKEFLYCYVVFYSCELNGFTFLPP